ncbi:integral membrane protein [Pustulibacterium marinum]|uniref:Integral membrane protein n=1 Tax=Pustulibacterium marinum TaxID=1224947 RepID=A0A1I7IH54_9FLAO|nr:DUF3817 domain-containing protein [Pustulibacterium marinum]SFU72251.1 integral membrane protein [Pustulibacterium marinum]
MNIRSFRIVSILEGISYLSFVITMPLKYSYHIEWPNKIVGMAHGILFVLYVFMAFSFKKQQNWNLKDLAIILLCSVIPFGAFWMERKYLKS